MRYSKILEKAKKKATKALFSTLDISDKYGHLERQQDRRYWKNKYLRELWQFTFKLGNKEFSPHEKRAGDMWKEIVALLQTMQNDGCKAMETKAWTGIKLTNHSYIISCSSDETYVTAHGTAAQRSMMSAEDTACLMIAFDSFLSNWEQEIDEALLAYGAEKQAGLVLKMTASVILEDILAANEGVNFKMKLQKNGRLCCNIISQASWLPDKVFRTTWETLREDFSAALEDYYMKQHRRYYYQ